MSTTQPSSLQGKGSMRGRNTERTWVWGFPEGPWGCYPHGGRDVAEVPRPAWPSRTALPSQGCSIPAFLWNGFLYESLLLHELPGVLDAYKYYKHVAVFIQWAKSVRMILLTQYCRASQWVTTSEPKEKILLSTICVLIGKRLDTLWREQHLKTALENFK